MHWEDSFDHKYVKLKKWLIDGMTNGQFRFGDRLPSENMLCRKFDLSRQTVRRALDELEKEGAIKKVRGSGTFVNRVFAQPQRTSSVGILSTVLYEYIFPTIMFGAENILTSAGYGIEFGITYNKVENEANFLKRMLEINPMGLIIEGSKTNLTAMNVDLFREIQRKGIPVVFIHNQYAELSDIPCIIMDDVGSAFALTELLIQNGHKKIAGIFKFDDVQGKYRYAGYGKALRAHKIPIVDEHVIWFDSYEWLGKEMNWVFEEIAECTAIVCYNDQVCIKVLAEMKRRGLSVPTDISVVSIDDTNLIANLEVGITSAVHPKEIIGEVAAKTLIKMIEDNTVGNKSYSKVMPVEIVVRQSIANRKKMEKHHE